MTWILIVTQADFMHCKNSEAMNQATIYHGTTQNEVLKKAIKLLIQEEYKSDCEMDEDKRKQLKRNLKRITEGKSLKEQFKILITRLNKRIDKYDWYHARSYQIKELTNEREITDDSENVFSDDEV